MLKRTLALAVGLTLSFCTLLTQAADTLKVSAIPDEAPTELLRKFKPLGAYLEQQFGSLERVPGQMMRGLNQQYTWRGTDTEITMTYHANTGRGFVFIDSRTLAPRFNDHITDSAE